METEEPTPINSEITVGNEAPEDLTPLVLQLMGQKDIDLALAQRRIARLEQQVLALTKLLAKKEEKKKD